MDVLSDSYTLLCSLLSPYIEVLTVTDLSVLSLTSLSNACYG